MISIADLIGLADNPQVAYDGYDELRQAARRRNGGFADPAGIPLTEEVIRHRGRDWCQSVIGKPMMDGLRSISSTDADMLLVADERGLEPPMPAWLDQWKAESAETRRQDEARDAAQRRDRDRWDAALANCGVAVEVRPNVDGRRYNTVLNDGPLRHVVPLADARSSQRRHQAGRALCEASRTPRTLGEPTSEPATCQSCLKYTAEIRPVHGTS